MVEPLDSRRQWILTVLDRYELRLVRYARRLLGDDASARDAVQHTFARLCEQPEESLNGRLAPWLYTVCRNRAMDVLRGQGRTESLETCDAPPPTTAELDPADAVERSELHQRLRERVARLPGGQGEAVGLWADGLSYGEIARILDTPEGNVRVLVHRGLSRLRTDPIARRLLGES